MYADSGAHLPWRGEKAHVSETQPRPLPHAGHLELPAGAESHALSHPTRLSQLGPGPFIWNPPSFLAPKIPVCGRSETRSLPYSLPGRGSRPYCSGQGTGPHPYQGAPPARLAVEPGSQGTGSGDGRSASNPAPAFGVTYLVHVGKTHTTPTIHAHAQTHAHTHKGSGDSEVGN